MALGQENGCLYKTGSKSLKEFVKGRVVTTTLDLFCNKLVADGSIYCPMHLLLLEDEANRIALRSMKLRQRKNWKKHQDEVLAESPLAAVNPSAGLKEKKRTYTEPE